MRTSGVIKEKLTIKFDEESSLVAETDKISNLILVSDIIKILEYLDSNVYG
jgi:hypothetical protein